MTAILGDVRRQRRQLRHLMAPRYPHGMPRVQPTRAAATGLRHEIDDLVDAFDGRKRSMVSRMARLPTGLAAALRPTPAHPLLASQAIRRGRFRRGRGILLAECELTFQVVDLARLIGDLLPKAFILTTKTLDLGRLRERRRRRWGRRPLWSFPRSVAPLHAREGTELRDQVQEA